MNRVLLHPDDFINDAEVKLLDYRAQHIHQVLKAKVGDQLKVGQINGLCGRGVIQQITPQSVSLTVTLDHPPPAKIPLTLLLALPRPKAARRILRAATELGVESIILINSYRVEKSYWQSPLVDDAHLHHAMLEGLEQSGDTVLPSLQKAKLFKPFVEDQLPGLMNNCIGLVAHPYADADAPPQRQGNTLLAVGPEGGFIAYEIEKLQEAGLSSFSLGPRILRVETALPTLIGKLFA